jgi:hypothetical protein
MIHHMIYFQRGMNGMSCKSHLLLFTSQTTLRWGEPYYPVPLQVFKFPDTYPKPGVSLVSLLCLSRLSFPNKSGSHIIAEQIVEGYDKSQQP